MVGHRSRCWFSGCHHPVQHLDDAPRCDVPRAIVHDVELLAALIVTGFRVGVAVEDLDHPLGVLELHLLLLVALVGNLLLAFPLAGRHAVVARLLLLLLAELLHELLDLPALLDVVVPRVVHRVPWTALIAVGGLSWSLVATWAAAPTNRSSSSGFLLSAFFFSLFLFLLLF
jgi:hypothetical protein